VWVAFKEWAVPQPDYTPAQYVAGHSGQQDPPFIVMSVFEPLTHPVTLPRSKAKGFPFNTLDNEAQVDRRSLLGKYDIVNAIPRYVE
jgi:hypothetical protein